MTRRPGRVPSPFPSVTHFYPTVAMSKPHFLLAFCLTASGLIWAAPAVQAQANQNPGTADLASVVFAERDGLVAVEAEHFAEQTQTDVRAFYLTQAKKTPGISPDGDPSHVEGASGGAYLEILPDTRRTHADKLIAGTNFSGEPGKLAVLTYKVNFQNAGRYYVWVRAYSTGSEDNGLHVGLDGQWPESGQRMQWCQGKNTWRWESKQRTEKQHCGEPYKLYLDIAEPGQHTIHFSMREDGFEFDKWLMTKNRDFQRPEDAGPASNVHSGKLPATLTQVLPKSNTEKVSTSTQRPLTMPASMFADGKVKSFYLDQGKWLAINPDQAKTGTAERTFPFPTGVYHVTLLAVGENDGKSSYSLSIDQEAIGSHESPLATTSMDDAAKYHKTWQNIMVTEGDIVGVTANTGSVDGKEFSRARWGGVAFTPADAATQKAAIPHLKEQAKLAAKAPASSPQTSPTKAVSNQPLHQPRQSDGDGKITVGGDLKTWHKVTLDLNGPYAHEQDNAPNPFTDYRMTVTFEHSTGKQYVVPGYFAADGKAANSSAQEGTTWRAHFAPDQPGAWTYSVSFHKGDLAAIDADAASQPVAGFDAKSGTIEVAASDKSGRDLRAHGRLQYVGKNYLQFAGSKQYFLKVGADAPETLLAYADFDNTIGGNLKKAPIKTWSAHEQDWKKGDPTWKNGKGKGLIGAVNYLSGKGCNAFSFLTYNAGGDGDNVWPFIHRDDKLHYDCSKLDQWGTVFDHGTAKGMYLHFKMQETENDDHKRGTGKKGGRVNESLDGGNLGVQRKLYCRELVARFGHNLALNWNIGEENTQSTSQIKAMIDYIADVDAYDHHIVLHTYPSQQDSVYGPLLGDKSKLTGVSLQNSSLETTHAQTLKWVEASNSAGKPWVVAFDESGSAKHAQCPDLGYNGFDGHDNSGKMAYTQHKVRKQTLWGTLMAGGAGCEYYFGYQFDQNDIVCEDWRSRDQSWDYCRIAIGFFHDHQIPFWEMKNADQLVGNPKHQPGKFCFAKQGETYLVYLPEGGEHKLNLNSAKGEFTVQWFNPRAGGELANGSVARVTGGGQVSLGLPPADHKQDWLAVVRAAKADVAQDWLRWQPVATNGKPHKRHEAGMIQCDGKMYLIGGRRIQPVDVFDPQTLTWTQAAAPPIEVHHVQPVVWDHRIWLAGAMTGRYPRETAVDRVLIYDPREDSWTWGPEIPKSRRRGGAGAVIDNGSLYLVCGIQNGHWDGCVSWVDRLDLATNQWHQLADAPHVRDHFQAAVIHGKLYAAGGRKTSGSTKEVFNLTIPQVDVFDLQSQAWTTLPESSNLPAPRAGCFAFELGDELLIAGGESTAKMAHGQIHALDTNSHQWRTMSVFSQGRHGTGIGRFEDSLFTAAGAGSRGGSKELDSTEVLRLPKRHNAS
ncbi:Galactose oxidase, central domain [Neorhodopirellula lusitana]|uniref:Galactose oxidase, central domain n=2 Tax=Neorhodopirellula lusitana TaxID=445327 RepID=A0ABY1Q3Z5_9BACT|nr:Galactose oxidase, central domain [Neorhodopirellula lusitana]